MDFGQDIRSMLNTVASWMSDMGFPVRLIPLKNTRRFESPCELALRLELHSEEVGEVAKAIRSGSVGDIAEEICDTIWVLLGTAATFGLDLESAWERVCQKNFKKAGKPLDRLSERVRREHAESSR